ncbi:MAG TPA: hypothetical protein VES89_05385 [Candidatus Competibacteraceae bacterium]|nr:hypothetical protein [Candidatus Competibacteraceae bacterium]
MKKLIAVTTLPFMAVVAAFGLFVAMCGTPEAPYSQPGFDHLLAPDTLGLLGGA